MVVLILTSVFYAQSARKTETLKWFWMCFVVLHRSGNRWNMVPKCCGRWSLRIAVVDLWSWTATADQLLVLLWFHVAVNRSASVHVSPDYRTSRSSRLRNSLSFCSASARYKWFVDVDYTVWASAVAAFSAVVCWTDHLFIVIMHTETPIYR